VVVLDPGPQEGYLPGSGPALFSVRIQAALRRITGRIMATAIRLLSCPEDVIAWLFCYLDDTPVAIHKNVISFSMTSVGPDRSQ
jgi:hypothetical protein